MLDKFGFTPTEAKVYQALLRLGPSTGYVVARELGIARANVYQALDALHRRSAARKAATRPAQYSATGPAALLTELERSVRRDLTELEEELQSLPLASGGAVELEQVRTIDQLMIRAASCVDSARTELLAVTGPWAQAMNARFPAAAGRKVQVRVVSLGAPAPDGALVRPVSDQALRGYWGGMPVAVVADRDRAVCGILKDAHTASGIATTMPGIIPWLRHVIRRELSGSPGETA